MKRDNLSLCIASHLVHAGLNSEIWYSSRKCRPRLALGVAGSQDSFPLAIQPVYDDKPIDIVELMETAGHRRLSS